MQGYVKWFDIEKGYGFVTAQDGDDYFVHYSGIAGEGYKILTQDRECEFDIETSENGKTKAINVKEI